MAGREGLKRGWVLAALMLTMMLAAMDIAIVATALPQIVSDLGGFNKISWVFSIYLLAQTVTIPLYGKLADLFGRKRVLVVGVAVFLIGSAACAAAWNIWALIAFRGLQGLGAGSIMATVNTIAGDIYTVAERAAVQGWLSSVWGISAVVGPALGGALVEYFNWRWIFLINVPIGLLAIFLLLRFFKEHVVPARVAVDYKGAVLITATLSLFFVFLLEGGQSWPWASAQSAVLLAAAVLLAVWAVRVERRAPDAIMPAWIWRNRTMVFTNLAVAAMGVVMMGPDTYLPTFTQASLGLGVIASGFVLASMSIGWPTASALSGRLYLRIGFRNTALIGSVLVLAASIAFLCIPRPQPISLIVLDQVLIGAGFGLLFTPSLVGLQSMVAWEHRGVVTGANIFCRNLGQSLGAAVMGAIFNNVFLFRMDQAPAGTPNSTTDVIRLVQDPATAAPVRAFLREAIDASMQGAYWGMVAFAVLLFLLLVAVPNRSPNGETQEGPGA